VICAPTFQLSSAGIVVRHLFKREPLSARNGWLLKFDRTIDLDREVNSAY
jgi:hypothetical protein